MSLYDHLKKLFTFTETTIESAWDSTAHVVKSAIEAEYKATAPQVLNLADQSVAAAAIKGGTGAEKWDAAWAVFAAGLHAFGFQNFAVSLAETVLQMAVTKLESVKAA